MPKKQPTAAKRARNATRAGAKYTAALREDTGGFRLPPHVDVFDDQVLPEEDRIVVDCLRALAAEGGPLPVRLADPDPEIAESHAKAARDGRPVLWKRWASVEAAVDGYVLRESRYGPGHSGYTSTKRGPRVPVPVRAADGTVTVAAMPEWALLHEGQWIWIHTGWPIERPGQIVDPPQKFLPGPGLNWEVAVWLDLGIEDGKVAGEDYIGGPSAWSTVGWFTNREDAARVARAYTAHRSHYARADVIEHGQDAGVVSLTRDTFVQAPDAPVRPRPARPTGPRPASPHRSEIPEPAWFDRKDSPPDSSLIVWTGASWRTLAWTDYQAAHIAAALGIGAGGPYEWAEGWGPRHPDKDMHDWTQEGRELTHRIPDTEYPERSTLIKAAHRAKADALVAGLANRGGLTPAEAAARLAAGGEKYLHVLDVGQAVISRALHTARRALPEGPERTAVRHALDDLIGRHLLPPDAERIANEQLDSEIEAERAPGVTAWCRRAVAEYIAPAPDPASVGIEGFRPQDA
ncbi:hypothetical protein [Streptomyces sp. NPDC091217]|uniref:hypothetical protein n=1 Tax=Streptomyces sp. NPDC091217 TaxID=3365975 RepID=UPI003821C23E